MIQLDNIGLPKWGRGFGILYGTILLLLLTAGVIVEHRGARAIANGAAAQPVRPSAANGWPTAWPTAKSSAQISWQ